MSGVTKLDRIRNERIRGGGEISKKVQESRLKWYGHALRREDEYVGKRVMGMEVSGKRRRGRPKRRWLDSIRNENCQGRTHKTGLNGGVSQDTPIPHKSWKRCGTRRRSTVCITMSSIPCSWPAVIRVQVTRQRCHVERIQCV